MALFASYMVIAEAYVALQHHYRVSKPDAKAALRSVLGSGLVAPTGGDAVIDALATQRGCGLLDRLIVLQYGSDQLDTLTLDRKMAALLGIDVDRTISITFAIGSGLAAVAGLWKTRKK